MSTDDPPGAHGAELISVDGLTRAFGARTAIRSLSLVVREGEVFGFVGANGGGKTTALRLIAGLLKADGGRGRVLGLDLLRARDEIRRHIGYMSQHFSLYPDLAVIENLTFRAEIYGLPRPRDAADRAMAEFGLTAFSRQRAGRLSGGWARRLQFAAALIHSPRLILLDEPTAGLDIAHRQETWRRIFALAADGAGIVVSTHDLAEAEACTGVAFFADGLVQASGPPDALIAALAGSRDGAAHCTGGGLAEVASRLFAGAGRGGRRLMPGPFRLRIRRMAAVARVEMLHILRDRATVSLVLLVPRFQLALFGFAVNPNPRNIPLAIAGDAGTGSPVARIAAGTGYFAIVGDGLEPGQAARLVTKGSALVAIELPPPPRIDDSDDMAQATPTVIADATDPMAVRPALAALETALWRHIAELSGAPPVAGAASVDVVWLYNPDGRASWSLIPGLAGVVVMISMLMMGALTLVRERERGTWEALLATPVDAIDALVGKLSPYVVLGVAQAAIVIYAGRLLFGFPVPGAIVWLLTASALYAAAHLILGFAISAVARSQIQAVQAAIFFYLPSMLLSGFMFAFQGMPRWAQAIGELLPLTHFVRAARGVLLRGEGAVFVLHELAPIAAFALVAMALALSVYRRQVS